VQAALNGHQTVYMTITHADDHQASDYTRTAGGDRLSLT